MDDFYVTLSSNSSFDQFPKNKTSQFSVLLSKNLNFDADWRVSLSEIIYPNTINNVSENHNEISFSHRIEVISFEKKQIALIKKKDIVEIPLKNYSNLLELIKVINHHVFKKLSIKLFNEDNLTQCDEVQVSNKVELLRDRYNSNFDIDLTQFGDAQVSNKIELLRDRYDSNFDIKSEEISEIRTMTNDEIKLYENEKNKINQTFFDIKLKGRLSLQLGFTPFDNLFETRISPQRPNISYGIPGELYLYANIIEPQMFSDSCTQIIKVIKTTDSSIKYGEIVCKEILNRNYLKLNTHKIQEVSVEVRDSTGQLVNFSFGTFMIQLHFKKVKT